MSADHVTLGMHDVDSRPDADISLFAAKLSAMRELESFASYKRDVVKRSPSGQATRCWMSAAGSVTT